MSDQGPRRGKLAAWTLAVAGLAAIAVAASLGYPALVERWYGIPVVRTWGDLLEQEPVDLGNGITVRVGIEAKSAPLWSGVLVYCLAEGYPRGDDGHLGLGPLEVAIVEEGVEPGQDPETASVHDSSFSFVSLESRILFAQTVSVTSPAVRRVELRHGESKLWRRAEVRTGREAFHPWMPLAAPATPRILRTAAGDAAPLAGVVVNRADGIALPRCEGWLPQPIPVPAAGSPDAATPLPGLLPHPEQPTLKLRQAKDQLEIEAEEELVAQSPWDHFLARFWVNDQPFIPQTAPPGRGTPRGYAALAAPLTQATQLLLGLELELDAAKLGARPGDRIGLQLLYLDGGWEHVGPGREVEVRRFSPRSEPHRVLQTNRIELVAP